MQQRSYSLARVEAHRPKKTRARPLHFPNSTFDVNLLYSQMRSHPAMTITADVIDVTMAPLPWRVRPGSASMFVVRAGHRREISPQPRPIATSDGARPLRISPVGAVGDLQHFEEYTCFNF